jgi:NADH:ubiquinone oxidoreductase subunit K
VREGGLMPVAYLLVLSALLFSIGVYGVLARQNAVLILLSVELMLNAANINLIAFSAMLQGAGVPGQVFALFVITVAAAEVGIGLAIVILIFRNRQSVSVEELSLMKW